jgi:hypothetical protein
MARGNNRDVQKAIAAAQRQGKPVILNTGWEGELTYYFHREKPSATNWSKSQVPY